jgi:probable HAF family extracellular repeat protein
MRVTSPITAALFFVTSITGLTIQQAKAGSPHIFEIVRIDKQCVEALSGLASGDLGVEVEGGGDIGGNSIEAGVILIGKLMENCEDPSPTLFSYWGEMVYNSDPDVLIPPLSNAASNGNSVAAVGYNNQAVAAGFSLTDAGPYHAFRWTPSGGTIDLGGIGVFSGTSGVQSMAFGMARNGSVVVGESSSTTSIQTAFRWTASDNTMRDLGSLAGPSGFAMAFATSADGTVVVGQTNIPIFNPVHAFVWTLAPGSSPPSGTMSDIDGRQTMNSAAYAVNSTGTTVVGQHTTSPSQLASSGTAFQWTAATGMIDLGSLPNRPVSIATGASDNGVVVGYVDSFGVLPPSRYLAAPAVTTSRAFRWTQATGMQDLNTVAANAGVNMIGITLLTAYTVSPDGATVGGAAIFPDTPAGETTGYLLTYCDTTTGNNPCSTQPTSVNAAVLPASRSVQVGNTATAFASIINAGSATAHKCGILQISPTAANFVYQTTNPQTNALTGTPNTPVDIPAGATQSYVFAYTPTGAFAPNDTELGFGCADATPAAIISGVNTLLLSGSTTPVPDIVALAASGDPGIVDIPGASGSGAFAVATVNVGTAAAITATANTGPATLPVSISLCQTNPSTGQCLASPSTSVTTTINAGDTPTFGIFVTGSGSVPFDPANNRIFVQFVDGNGVVHGSTSVAVRTQ